MFDDHPLGAVTAKNLEVEHFLHSLRISDSTVKCFDLQATPAPKGTVSRLYIPVRDPSGRLVGSERRSIYEYAFCSNCQEKVSARDVARRHYLYEKGPREKALPFDDWRDCPHCGAPKKKSKVSWLLGQHPKYLASPGLAKGSLLYNAHRAKKVEAVPRSTRGTLLLCEGFGDVWALHEAGYDCAMAYMGSRCSEEQIDLIEDMLAFRPANERLVAVAADADKTGVVGGERTVRALRKRGILAFAITDYGEGAKDPSEVLRHRGAVHLANLIDQRIGNGICEAFTAEEQLPPQTGRGDTLDEVCK